MLKLIKSPGVLLLLIILALAIVAHAKAQDSTPVPTEEIAPPVVETTTTTTTTTAAPVTDAPVTDAGMTLNWLIAFVALWQSAGIAYAIAVEKSLKPALYAFVATFTDNVTIRNAALIVAVFIGAFAAVQQGGINLFTDAPGGLFTDASPAFLLVVNSIFVAAGAFIGAEVWSTLESWLKKAKAVTDIFTAQRAGIQGAGIVGSGMSGDTPRNLPNAPR